MSGIILTQGTAQHLPLADKSVHCSLFSPPYFNLRQYAGVVPEFWPAGQYRPQPDAHPIAVPAETVCLGNESTVHAYIWHLLLVLKEVKRTLRDDGTAWLIIADCYAASGKSGGPGQGDRWKVYGTDHVGPRGGKWHTTPGYEQGSLLGIPGLLHQAALADGWIVRGDVVWAKASPMPESVRGWAWQQARCGCVQSTRQVNGMQKMPGVGHREHLHTVGLAGTPSTQADPACPHCGGTGRLAQEVLRQGSWRHTRSTEVILQLTKNMGYWANSESVREGGRISSVIQTSYREHQTFQLSSNFRLQEPTSVGTHTPASTTHDGDFFKVCIRFAATLLESAQLQDNVSLPLLDTQVGIQSLNDLDSSSIVRSPAVERATFLARAFLQGNIGSAESFVEQLNGLGITLSDTDIFTKVGSDPLQLPRFVESDSDSSIRVNDASEVCQDKWRGNIGVDFRVFHNEENTPGRNILQEKKVQSGRNPRNVWREPSTPGADLAALVAWLAQVHPDVLAAYEADQANPRNVVTPRSANLDLAHYAAFPPALLEPLIKATCPERCCIICGAGWAPVVEHTSGETNATPKLRELANQGLSTNDTGTSTLGGGAGSAGWARTGSRTTVHGLRPTCPHYCTCDGVPGSEPGAGPCTCGLLPITAWESGWILDPFVGSGTSLETARALGRRGIGVDASLHYLRIIARERLGLADLDRWMGRSSPSPAEAAYTDLPLFGGP